jgi:adenosylmethionine-8-amino-7-oxononanoate aminotransferase
MAEDLDWPALLAYDRAHVWHPYAALPPANPPLPVVSASGARLRLADGREVVDGMSSWWSAIWGYRQPVIDAALAEQIGQVSHVMFGGLTHAPAVQLARRLAELAPAGLTQVFFADSGSVAVEVALKTAVQYQHSAGRPGRTRFLALEGGYHGDTLGAMSVCDPVGGMHHLFRGALPAQVFAPRPPRPGLLDPGWAEALRALVNRHSDELAALVAEPVVQGAGGMWFYEPECLQVMRDVADEHGLLLVFDEIATGFGRTGTMFACERAPRARPDIMCVGKALTGGYMTMAAMLCTQEVSGAVSHGEAGCLMHGPTFMANPLACAAALASTGLLLDGTWQDRVRSIEEGLAQGLAPASDLPGVRDVRALGAIGVVQLDHDVDMAAATGAALRHGTWLRPFRDLVYTMPPYICSEDDVARVAGAVVAAAAVA